MAPPPDLAPNPGFEQPAATGDRPAGWTSFAMGGATGRPVWVTSPHHGGTRAIGVLDATGEVAWHCSVPVTAGATYRLGGYGLAAGPAPARLQIAWFGQGHRYLGSSISPPRAWVSDWTELHVDGRAPATAVTAELVAGTTGGGSPVYLDDVTFLVVPATLTWATGAVEPIFSVGTAAVVPLVVASQSAARQTLPLTMTVADAAANVVTTAVQTLDLAPAGPAPATVTGTVPPGLPLGSTTVSLTLPVSTTGWYSITAQLGDALVTTASLRAAVVTATVPVSQPVARDPSPFGIGAYLTAIEAAGPTMTTTLRSVAGVGARWDREEVRWSAVEQQPGRYAWSTLDAAITAAHAARLSVLGVLNTWATWTRPYTPQGNADFAAFCAAAVQRYRPDGTLAHARGWKDGYGVRAWEIWNEPTTLAYWSGSPAQFGALLKAASAAVHRADRGATVMYTSWGAVGDPLVLAAAGRGAVDALALHLYAGPVAPEEQDLFARLHDARDRVGGKPVWVSETGYAVFAGGTTEPLQAAYLVRSYVQLLAAGAQHILWYSWRDSGREENFGLTTGDRYPKPAVVAYATMARLLAGMRPTGALRLGAALQGLTFARGRTQVAVVWSTAPTTGTMTLAFGSARLSALDLAGRPIGRVIGQVREIPLGSDPVYLTGSGLSHGAFAALIGSATVAGIPAVQVRVGAPDAPQSGLPHAVVTVVGQTNVTTRGTVTILAPASWAITPTVWAYGPLKPGATQEITVTATALHGLPDPTAAITAVVMPRTTTGQTATPISATQTVTTAAPVAETVALRGTPRVDGSLSGWEQAPPVLLMRRDQLLGDPSWTPATFAGAARLMWDDANIYVSAVVTDTDFYEPNTGFYLYQGDSLQFDLQFGGPAPYRFGAALTPRGPELFRYEGGGTRPPGPVAGLPLSITVRTGPSTSTIVYTVAIPWTQVGLAGPPPAGRGFLANVTVNDNRRGVRADWLTLTAGRGTGFSPAPFLSWSLRDGVAVGAVRAGPTAALTSTTTLTFTSLVTANALLIAPGRAAPGLRISLNGHPIPMAPPTPAGAPVEIDVSGQAVPGLNILTITAPPHTSGAVVTVLARPLPAPAPP